MYKVIIKYILIVCTVLMLGQLEFKSRTLGDYFVSGTKAFGLWTVSEIAQNPWVKKVALYKGFAEWFPLGEMKKKSSLVREKRAGVLVPAPFEKKNKEEMSEDDTDEEFLETELESDDSAVMEALP